MESSVKTKNILVLSSFFLLGFLCGFVVASMGKEDILVILEEIKGEKVVDIGIVEEEKTEIEQPLIEKDEERELCPIRVDISGAVKKPGVYCLEKDSAVVDLVKKANGFVDGFAQKYVSMRVNLATLLTDNSKVYIPFEEDSICQIIDFKLPKEITNITEPKPPVEPGEEESDCISINSASKTQLETLNGVGPSTAQKIIDGRPYEKLEDIMNVSGIGQATFDKFKDQICL
ncbi:hypothetical protein CVU76_03690 [Candidatus Dojkabacteria bacterium HGW-Dojkabacteria-1]|uniref:Helix-hairpin-helix DNA-binding motif class 1 domain-containing protein n=1 Tax=Candidatus Dojkabacteria bacterium HGW-Dojkabacteria-1 TaxID=2013761 RepID=A0A2N2F4L4_9BACT|nr:MAG: hypothetical protein CVU76_03690 [Candidatus Dojkabacteria bacterium HGW-Dojkabacteria-1]